MTDKSPKNLESRIQEHYDSLPPAERRLGDLLLGFPGEIATYSATELAELAGTSKAAATRFFRRLGYKDFNEARRDVRDAQNWGSPVYMAGNKKSKNRNRVISEQIKQDASNISLTLEGISPEIIQQVSKAASSAQRVFIVGFRNSRILALYLHRQLGLMRPDVFLLPQAGQTLGEDLVDVGDNDLLIVIALRRRVSLVPKIMRIAKDKGMQTLLITDPSATSILTLATWWIICQVKSTSIFDSYAASMSVLNLICGSMFHQSMDKGYARMRSIEALHDELSELEQSSK